MVAPSSRKKREGDEGCGKWGHTVGSSGTVVRGRDVFIKMLVGVGHCGVKPPGGSGMGGFF